MNDPIYARFLKQQELDAVTLAASTDRLSLVPVSGKPTTHYLAELRCRGLAKSPDGRIVEHDLWAFGISFPADYLRRAVPSPQVLTYLGPHPEPWHPNLRGPIVCLHLQPGTPLVDLVYSLYELVTWNLYSTSDEGLNHGAAQWARHEPASRFPVDRRPLKRPSLAATQEESR